MNIGIIGSGNVGSTLGEIWAKAGHQVMFSFSRYPERLQTLATQIGSNAMSGTPAEAVNFADVVLFAPNFWLAQEAIAQAGSIAGKIVIDATNPYRWGENGSIVRMVGENVSGAETIQKLMPGARLVKAYSSFQPNALRRSAERSLDRRLAIAIASDDEAAKTLVAQLAEDSGGRPFDLGSLRNASLMEIPGSFSSSDNLTLDAAFKQRLQVLGY
ncbi:NADPH-dependent F420 reductase [Chamaesiphon minutus]|uniref:Putative dinucleotide-binding enzyme n=1 Tax=Chamaesiphon minutus (strain ATCC 27169 / PCC 6605) TaxID=1173020 RepID=K9UFM8_CHAP6|nr:NADPH-dependent F420 reductase [Chamaesiphon minutus]AFY93226.1 putative dinucleotide-binding enzyme [Chamaesiphon minutus PCC 6605]